MNKEKDSTGASQANVPGVPQNASGVPVKRLRSSRRWIVIICIIVVVAAAAGVVVVTVTSPENIMRSYLRSKYGKDFVLVGELGRGRGGALQEHYYESEAHPVDNYGLRFGVVLDDGKMSDTYIEAGRIMTEEDRLRPYIERIFSKNTDIKVEFRLCEQGEASMKGFSGLLRAMRICKEKTAGMTEYQMFHSNGGLYHSYDLYIYDPDVRSIKTDYDKAKIIVRLKEVAKYLPDGRPSAMSFRYYIKEGDSELEVPASDLFASQNTRQLVRGFDKKVKKLGDTAEKCGRQPYPMERGWHLDKKERAKKRTKKRSGCGNVSN